MEGPSSGARNGLSYVCILAVGRSSVYANNSGYSQGLLLAQYTPLPGDGVALRRHLVVWVVTRQLLDMSRRENKFPGIAMHHFMHIQSKSGKVVRLLYIK